MNNDYPRKARKRAEEHFRSGFRCAESVLLALTEGRGLDSELIPRVATAFCSGLSRTGGTCGALNGAVLAISAIKGRNTPDEPVDSCYEAVSRLVRAFEIEYGSRRCDVLLGCDIATPEGQEQFKRDNLMAFCTALTGRTAELAAQVLNEGSKEKG